MSKQDLNITATNRWAFLFRSHGTVHLPNQKQSRHSCEKVYNNKNPCTAYSWCQQIWYRNRWPQASCSWNSDGTTALPCQGHLLLHKLWLAQKQWQRHLPVLEPHEALVLHSHTTGAITKLAGCSFKRPSAATTPASSTARNSAATRAGWPGPDIPVTDLDGGHKKKKRKKFAAAQITSVAQQQPEVATQQLPIHP